MAYPLSYRAPTGKTLKAVVKDLETGSFWDQTNSVWVAAETAACQIAFTEGSAGFYTASGGLTPVQGGIYQLKVLDSNDTTYESLTTEVFTSATKTVLQVVNAIQLEMRLPQSSALTDNFAKIVLAKMNKILTIVLPESNVFEHLKVQGSFTINNQRALYRVNPVNAVALETINFIKRPDLTVVQRAADDMKFRHMADHYTQSGLFSAPRLYRIAQRDYGFPVLEFTPAPDKAYLLSYEGVKSAAELTLATDFVPLPAVVQAGAHMLYLQGLGRDATAETGIFNMALSRATTVSSNSMNGDFHF